METACATDTVTKLDEDITENLDKLYKEKKFNEIISLTTEKLLTDNNNIDLYIRRGNALYEINQIDNAIYNYDKVLDIDPECKLAIYNRAIAWNAKKEYNKALEDCNTIINKNPDDIELYYYARAIIWKTKKEYSKVIEDLNKAIDKNPQFENAYYKRGLAKYEMNYNDEDIINDFKSYLELTKGKNETWTIYARYYINILNEKKSNPELSKIREIIKEIKETLQIKEDYITHYTSFYALKKLILEKDKFRLYEGNFMNDPSEGKEFYNFLEYNPTITNNEKSAPKFFSPKPFIGSFVNNNKDDDLNLWRFYGKEQQEEAKGCAITLKVYKFIENIKNTIANVSKKDRQDNESEIQFYKVLYLNHNTLKFNNFESTDNNKINTLLETLKEKVKQYKNNKIELNDCLNSIAFLFKSDDYKNENELRLVVSGLEFEKFFDERATPPRVYIELEPIKDMVYQITLGPKVDKVTEWASVLYYKYKKDTPIIKISHIPYK